MTTPAARRDLLAHQESVTCSDAAIAKDLWALCDTKILLAYLGAVKETRAVAQWAAGQRRPSSAMMTRLRTAYQAAALLGAMDGAGVVQAWFAG
ncbi:MAG: hypothetical protein M3Y49_04805 [Actinomycetota bacterium]|nr:hypothetical protein [Actinomycetota bacterium]